MKAHNVKYGTKVIVTDDEITIHRLDGMYCNAIDKDGYRIYIAAWTEVEPCILNGGEIG